MTVLRAADLFPPHIPSATKLETPEIYHGGISLESIADGNLVVLVDAWLNLALDDKCELYWDNDDTPVKTQIINDTTVQRLRFEVPVGFITNDSAKVFYTVTRFPQEPVKSEELLMWVKLNRPGGEDTDSEPGHSGLKYSLVPDPSKGVGAEMAKGGIRMLIEHYQNIATYDRIVGKWRDEEVSFYPVTREQIDGPDNNPIFVTFTEEVIKRQGNGRDIPVTFRVVDRVGNLSDPQDPWAKFTYVSVDLTDRLPAPLIRVNNQTVAIIDLAQLGSSNVIVRVYFTSPVFQQDDEVRLTWTGTPPQGQPIVVGPLKKSVGSVPDHFDFEIPNASVQALGGGSAKAKYEVYRAGLLAGTSNDASVTVTGEIKQLEPPTVVEAPAYLLDPNLHQNGFTVVFNNLRLNANDELELEVVGRPGDGSVPPEKKVVAAGQTKVEFKVHFSITGANLQRTVVLKYRVISAGQETPVQSVELKIGELLQLSMPMPKFERFDGEVLDIGLIKDDTKVLCGAWPFQRAGLKIWLKYLETFAEGGERVKEQFIGHEHDQGVGLSYLTEVEWLRGCKADSRLTVILNVALFSASEWSDATACQTRHYSIKAGLDECTDFTEGNRDGWLDMDGSSFPSKVVLEAGQHFLESIKSNSSGSEGIIIKKLFPSMKSGRAYTLSFDYMLEQASVTFGVNEVIPPKLPATSRWASTSVRFTAKELYFSTVGLTIAGYGRMRIDNIRLRESEGG